MSFFIHPAGRASSGALFGPGASQMIQEASGSTGDLCPGIHGTPAYPVLPHTSWIVWEAAGPSRELHAVFPDECKKEDTKTDGLYRSKKDKTISLPTMILNKDWFAPLQYNQVLAV